MCGDGDMTFKVLILGGTSAGRQLAERLTSTPDYAPLLSFAGRTTSLQLPEIPHRVGGFGGVAGLAEFLARERFSALIDATHAFAAQMSIHAAAAAAATGVPLLRLEVEPWIQQNADHWLNVNSIAEAARALGETPRRVLLTIGRQEVAAFRDAPHHDYLIRAIDAFDPGLSRARVLCARGPFERGAEIALLRHEQIEVIVSKNAGTGATYAKIEAARELGLPVIMVARPPLPAAATVHEVAEALRWLDGLKG